MVTKYVLVRCFIKCSLEAMASGYSPSHRHDDQAWRQCESQRQLLAGTILAFGAALPEIKGNWMDFSTSLGFSSWADARHPCPCCRCDKAGIGNFAFVSARCQRSTHLHHQRTTTLLVGHVITGETSIMFLHMLKC